MSAPVIIPVYEVYRRENEIRETSKLPRVRNRESKGINGSCYKTATII